MSNKLGAARDAKTNHLPFRPSGVSVGHWQARIKHLGFTNHFFIEKITNIYNYKLIIIYKFC